MYLLVLSMYSLENFIFKYSDHILSLSVFFSLLLNCMTSLRVPCIYSSSVLYKYFTQHLFDFVLVFFVLERFYLIYIFSFALSDIGVQYQKTFL